MTTLPTVRVAAVAAARLECEEMRDRMIRMAELERRKSALQMKRELDEEMFVACNRIDTSYQYHHKKTT